MPVDQAEFNALREIVRENTGDEMMLLNRFTVRGMRHALGMEQESGIETLVRNGVIVEKAGHYEFAPEIQRALVREELGDSLRVAEAITRLRLGKQATGLENTGYAEGRLPGRDSWQLEMARCAAGRELANRGGPSEEPVWNRKRSSVRSRSPIRRERARLRRSRNGSEGTPTAKSWRSGGSQPCK